MKIEPSPEISHRDDFALLAMWRGLRTAVEIGVEKGLFMETFLSRAYNMKWYIGVDPYLPYWEDPFGRAADQLAASIKAERFPAARLAVTTGDKIAKAIQDKTLGLSHHGTVDFVYIDGLHEYDAVKSDIEDWWPVVSEKGILAGHDFDATHPGVMQAVREFAQQNDLTVYLTWNDPCCYSWYVYKSGRPDTYRRCGPPRGRTLAKLPL